MEIALKSNKHIKWLPDLWPIYALIAVSMLYGFWVMYNLSPYLPWHVKLHGALRTTILGHFGLWLATIRTKSKLRFVTAAILLPTMIGVSFLWLSLGLPAAIAAFGCMSWLMYHVVTGK